MKKKALVSVLAIAMALTMTACGEESTTLGIEPTKEAVAELEKTPVENAEEKEAPHEHAYKEEVTKEATCLEEGEKTFACECGDTYSEAIKATGHDFAEYVSNEDATYEADGTETATCSVCGETDTRVAEGSMLTYTFEDMEATKYAKSDVNVRSLPTADGEKLGGLSTNDEVKVTGKCNETGWYRIEYSDGLAYVSDSYLVDNKVETNPSASESKPVEEKPVETPTPEPTPESTPAPTPEPMPEPEVQEEWVVVETTWTLGSDTHKCTKVWEEIYSMKTKEEVTEEAHTWVADEVRAHYDPEGNEYWYAGTICSVCGYDKGEIWHD